MLYRISALPQDTTVVAVARDGLATVSAWTMVGVGLAFAALLVVLTLILVELRHLSRTWSGFLSATNERSQPIIDHARKAAQNAEHITSVVRTETERLGGAVEGLSAGIGEVSAQLRTRLTDLAALADFAQSEAEDAVLDTAAKVRALRSGAGLLNLVRTGVQVPEEAAKATDRAASRAVAETQDQADGREAEGAQERTDGRARAETRDPGGDRNPSDSRLGQAAPE